MFDLPEEPPADPNETRPGKRKRNEKLDQAVSMAKKSRKTSYEVATQLPKASIKSSSKNSPAIKSSKNRCSSLDPSFRDEDIFYDYPLVSSFEPNFDDGLNSSEVKIFCFKQRTKLSFYGHHFKGRTVRIEKSLNDEKPPEKMITFVSENKQL